MKIVQINTCNYGSTGNIMLSIAEKAREQGHEAYVCVPKSRSNDGKIDKHTILIGDRISRNIHLRLGYFTGKGGAYSKGATRRFLKRLDEIKPDVIHLHNLHNSYINLKMLFDYIKKNSIRTIWTLHDCWPFTGHCPHFDMIGCDKWKNGCYECPQYRSYPASFKDNSKKMYQLKREWFTGVKDLTIVTPSSWLGALAKQSFLQEYPLRVINNGINLDIFKPSEGSFREKYNIKDKLVILGVAFGWGARKGLDVFVELSKGLPNNYQIVLVGTDDEVDKMLPQNIISIHRTHDQRELAEIYTSADLFVNPTREENYPTVNMESLACGTPVLTFKTGGSPEIIDEKTGAVVDKDDLDTLKKEILRITTDKPYSKEGCTKKAIAFDKNEKFREYINLYAKNHTL